LRQILLAKSPANPDRPDRRPEPLVIHRDNVAGAAYLRLIDLRVNRRSSSVAEAETMTRHSTKGPFKMSKVVVTNSLTLDGVMQAPGRPDEDRRGGFEHGGWALPYADAVIGEEMGKGMAQSGPLLFGRRTYEDFYAVWPNRPDPNPFTAVLNNAQ
jgi:hypothetical protein